jgi:hypothetical protein
MAVDTILSRLEGVRQTGAGRWIAKCPAHGDKNPSLAVRELDDGRVLLHCFSGCSAEEVLDAVGMTFSDLYPEKSDGHCRHPERRPWPASDVLRCISFDALVVANCAATMAGGVALSEADQIRLVLAAEHLQEAATLAGVSS